MRARLNVEKQFKVKNKCWEKVGGKQTKLYFSSLFIFGFFLYQSIKKMSWFKDQESCHLDMYTNLRERRESGPLNDRISTINLWSATCPFPLHLFSTWRILSCQRDERRNKQHFIKHPQHHRYTQEFFAFQKNHTAMLNFILQFGDVCVCQGGGLKKLKKSWRYNQLLNR